MAKSNITYTPYHMTGEGSEKKKFYEDILASIAKMGNFTYSNQEQYDAAMNKLLNKPAFSYNLNEDALYQQYADQYTSLGKLAMEDTIGQASAMTGGYGNSYAATAGNQAYQSYLGQLNNMAPQLYQMAMNKYQMEDSQLRDNIAMLLNDYGIEKSEFDDEYNRLLNKYELANNDYFNSASVYNSAFNNDLALLDRADTEYWNQVNAYLKALGIEAETGKDIPDDLFPMPERDNPIYSTNNPDYWMGSSDSGTVGNGGNAGNAGNGGTGGITNGITGNGTSNAEISKWSSTYNDLVSQYGEEDATYKLAQLINEKYGYKDAKFINKIGEQLGISDLESVYREIAQPTTTGEWKKVFQDIEKSYGSEFAADKIAQMLKSRYGDTEEGALRAADLGKSVANAYKNANGTGSSLFDASNAERKKWTDNEWNQVYSAYKESYGDDADIEIASDILQIYGYTNEGIAAANKIGNALGIRNLGSLFTAVNEWYSGNASSIDDAQKNIFIQGAASEYETLKDEKGRTQAAWDMAQSIYDVFGAEKNITFSPAYFLATSLDDSVVEAYVKLANGETAPDADHTFTHKMYINSFDPNNPDAAREEHKAGVEANRLLNNNESYFSQVQKNIENKITEGASRSDMEAYLEALWANDYLTYHEYSDLLYRIGIALKGKKLRDFAEKENNRKSKFKDVLKELGIITERK